MKAICVDDEKLVLEDIVYECNKTKQFESVEAFLSSQKAIEYIKQNRVDVAFLDIDMPDINGIELAKKLHEIDDKLYIVFTTGYPQYALDAFGVNAIGYVLKPVDKKQINEQVEHIKLLQQGASKGVVVKTFGNFEVYSDGRIVRFKRSKSKEILAYLVDKKGTGVNNKEIAAFILNKDDYNEATQNHVHILTNALKKDLEAYGIGDIVINEQGSGIYAIDINKIDCDKYHFDNGDKKAKTSYKGEYMAEYEWAEGRSSYMDNVVLSDNDFI